MKKDDALVQVTRMALAGREQDIQQYVRRMIRSKEFGDIKDQLVTLLADAPTKASPLRNAQFEAIPVDLDSRLQLIRYEVTGQPDINPVWNDTIGGKLNQLIAERKQTDTLLKKGLAPVRTALFTGPPGVGKTMAARWLSSELGLPLLVLDLSAVMSSFLGRTGSNLRMVLDYAKNVDCILLLDEIDAIAKKRDDSTEVGELKRLVTVLLQEIDDWPPTSLLVAATNHPDLLDPAVWRRFETIVEFTVPERPEVLRTLEAYLEIDSNRAENKEILDVLAVVMDQRSYSDIRRLSLAMRKQAVLLDVELREIMSEYIHDEIRDMPKEKRYKVALALSSMGYSERKVYSITTVSRETLRKLRGSK